MDVAWTILERLRNEGFHSSILSTGHVSEIEEEMAGRNRNILDAEFYEECLNWCEYRLPEELPDARSIIVVAVPQPRLTVEFHLHGITITLTIPPTYNFHVNDEVRSRLSDWLASAGYGLVPAMVPVKLLAVRSGLGAYGRNNICYIPGFGSYHRLMAFYTDMNCEEDSWTETSMMDRCRKCSACLKACPTEAISEDRFLLRAERCLTYHNERKADFPEWIDPVWHHCIVGCMFCQNVCPENRTFRDWMEPAGTFSEEETARLLDGRKGQTLSPRIREKITGLGLLELLETDALARNIRVLLEKEAQLEREQNGKQDG